MITFEITKKPTRTLMTVQDIEVVVGTKYDIALESQVELTNEHPYQGEPFDSFKYKINNAATPSVNEGIVTINFQTDKTVVPAVINAVKSIPLFGSFFFSSEIVPSQYYDRITITSITGKGSWYYNGNPVVAGQTLFYYELVNNLYFTADDLGVENNYAEINWTSGTILGAHAGTNSLVVNSSSDGAELFFSGPDGYVTDAFGVEKYTYFIYIEKGINNASYKLNVDTNGFPEVGIDEKIEIYERDLPLVLIETLGVTEIVSTLDSNGATIYILYIYKAASIAVERNIVLTLTEVNGSLGNINPLYDQITLLIPITATP